MLGRTLGQFAKTNIKLMVFGFSSQQPPPPSHTPEYLKGYEPPPSKLEEFTSYINQIESQNMKEKAAQMLGTLQADQNIYMTLLETMNSQYKLLETEEQEVVSVIAKKKALENMIQETIENSKAIEHRYHRELENIKIYGVTRLARQIIEIADHLELGLTTLQKSQKQKDKKTYTSLKELYQNFQKMLQKYEIHQYNPIGEPFDPNLQESLGYVDNSDPVRSNHVAETQRTGWKIKDRLLRHATVLIYK